MAWISTSTGYRRTRSTRFHPLPRLAACPFKPRPLQKPPALHQAKRWLGSVSTSSQPENARPRRAWVFAGLPEVKKGSPAKPEAAARSPDEDQRHGRCEWPTKANESKA